MAKFEIKQVFRLSSRNCLCVAGNILSGVIHIGDIICLKSKKYKIKGLDWVLMTDGSLPTLVIDADKREVEPFINETVIILPTNGGKNTKKES